MDSETKLHRSCYTVLVLDKPVFSCTASSCEYASNLPLQALIFFSSVSFHFDVVIVSILDSRL